jgi:hypothetical protein
VITKPEEHDINRAGKRLLRGILEPLDWVVNDVQEDYGIDSSVQVFDGNFPTGTWFHVQLKSSGSSDYSAEGTFVSQELSIDHARHYALEMQDPVLIIHADVASKTLYWYAPQLDRELATALCKTSAKSITLRIPTYQSLPGTAPELLTSLEKIYLVLANRQLTSAPIQSFVESLRHLPDQQALHRAFQDKNDTLRLQRVYELFEKRDLDQARPRTEAILADPDSTVEIKFWARIQLEAIDYMETARSAKPGSEVPKLLLAHAKSLWELTSDGPSYLKFYSLIAARAAELEVLVDDDKNLLMALHQHLEHGNPMTALGLYARHSGLTKRITFKYNQCVRLARYAAGYRDRWVLGRALTKIVNPIGKYLVTLRSDGNIEAERAFAQSALQVSKLAAWIGQESGDPTTVVLAILSALITVQSEDSDAFRWGEQVARSLRDPEIRADALHQIERAKRRWRGEPVEGDYQWDTTWQVIQNMAAGLGIDVSDENDPLVRGLRIAAKDDSSERVLATCEHILASLGATGPIARRIQRLFNLGTAGSKVVHCTLHNYHQEGIDLDSAYAKFKRSHCDSCPDKKPRPAGWEFTDEVRQQIEARNYEFVERLAGTEHGIRYTAKD